MTKRTELPRAKLEKGLGLGALALVLVIGAVVLATAPRSSPSPRVAVGATKADATLQPPPQEPARLSASDLAARAHAAVKDNLRDPGSAEFSNTQVFKTFAAVCGRVNSRNGFGGMTGRQGYLVIGDTVMIEEQDPQLFAMQKDMYCAGKADFTGD